ncbi:MAG: glycoside hydrolase family 57 protein [Paludibacteraceae bacterium]|nr:glycoside hydrolase family 57 protein [Paludibacteraceae bacterium]
MKNICFCFQIHAPYRLKRYRFFEIGQDHYYYDDMATEEYITWLTQTSYMPLCQTIREMIKLSKNRFHCGLAVSGTMLELFEQYIPEMIDVLKELAASKCVDFVRMPYSYSLSAQCSMPEWEAQVQLHADKMRDVLGVSSTTLWNTELLYTDEIASAAWKMGYKAMMSEGAKHILSYKSPNYLYGTCINNKQSLLLRNSYMSDALSFHFSDPQWKDYPMDAEKYINQLQQLPEQEQLVNLWMGAETFGVLQTAGTGIFDFLKALPYYAMEQGLAFVTPTEAAKKLSVSEPIVSPYPLTWTGEGKDLSMFLGNDLQQEATNKLYAVTQRVHLCSDLSLKRDWTILQDSNYLHYMNHIDQGSSTFESAYDAFINYMNILSDFLQRVEEQYPTTIGNEELNSLLQTITNQEKEIASLQAEIKKMKKKQK